MTLSTDRPDPADPTTRPGDCPACGITLAYSDGQPYCPACRVTPEPFGGPPFNPAVASIRWALAPYWDVTDGVWHVRVTASDVAAVVLAVKMDHTAELAAARADGRREAVAACAARLQQLTESAVGEGEKNFAALAWVIAGHWQGLAINGQLPDLAEETT